MPYEWHTAEVGDMRPEHPNLILDPDLQLTTDMRQIILPAEDRKLIFETLAGDVCVYFGSRKGLQTQQQTNSE